jgi:hypothetical protein
MSYGPWEVRFQCLVEHATDPLPPRPGNGGFPECASLCCGAPLQSSDSVMSSDSVGGL